LPRHGSRQDTKDLARLTSQLGGAGRPAFSLVSTTAMSISYIHNDVLCTALSRIVPASPEVTSTSMVKPVTKKPAGTIPHTQDELCVQVPEIKPTRKIDGKAFCSVSDAQPCEHETRFLSLRAWAAHVMDAAVDARMPPSACAACADVAALLASQVLVDFTLPNKHSGGGGA